MFRSQPGILHILETLQDVGLGYIRLGQPFPTLSGGEAQRVKLSRELAKRSTGDTLYILDEPTTGLHFDDIARLLRVLDRLVDAGNTVVVIEHNLDVIKTADHLVDLGPDGGGRGGELVVCGTPEAVSRHAGILDRTVSARHPGAGAGGPARFLKVVYRSYRTGVGFGERGHAQPASSSSS